MPWMRFERSIRLAGDLDIGKAPQDLAEHHRDLAAREVGAQAEVRPRAAEADMLVRRARTSKR